MSFSTWGRVVEYITWQFTSSSTKITLNTVRLKAQVLIFHRLKKKDQVMDAVALDEGTTKLIRLFRVLVFPVQWIW